METKTVYQLDAQSNYVGPVIADESPLEPGVFLIPGGCVTLTPPKPAEGKVRRWDGRRWRQVEVPE